MRGVRRRPRTRPGLHRGHRSAVPNAGQCSLGRELPPILTPEGQRGGHRREQNAAFEQVAALPRTLTRATAAPRSADCFAPAPTAGDGPAEPRRAPLSSNELACARWAWFDLTARVLTVPADVAKSGRTETVPLHAGLADLLAAERRRRGIAAGRPVADDELVVGAVVNGHPALPRHYVERLRAAAAWLGMPAIDATGRVLDLHAMRTSLATALTELGVSDGTRGDLMRHRAAGVTEQHYVQRSLDLLRQAIDTIPAEAADVAGLAAGEPREAPKALSTGAHGFVPPSKAAGDGTR